MITSVQNTKIKQVRELLSAKKHREKAHLIVLEGVRLSEEALLSNIPIQYCLFSDKISERGREIAAQLNAASVEIEEVSADLLERVSDTRTSQGILLVIPIPDIPLRDTMNAVIVLDNIRDPGNMGTILRTAAAMNIAAVLLTPGTTDPFSPKVMRAGMGAHFRVPIRTMQLQEIYSFCKNNDGAPLSILLMDAACSKPCWEIDLKQPTCLVVGSEADGASQEIREMADECASIPMSSTMESFNAATSASILVYEMIRQRNTI